MTKESYKKMVEQLAEMKNVSTAVAALIIQAAIANFKDTLSK